MTRLALQMMEAGLLTPSDLARAEEVSRRTDGRLARTLAQLGIVAEVDILQSQAGMTGLPVLTRSSFPEAPLSLPGLNRQFLQRHAIVPVAISDGVLSVALADMDDDEAVRGLAFASGAVTVDCALATFSDIEEFLGGHAAIEDIALGAGSGDDIARLIEDASDAPVIRLVQRLINSAVDRRASDVHIEPMAHHVSVRYRIDGRLIEVETLPKALAPLVASRIKVMAGLDIAESRLPQDGRLRVTVRGQDVDVRVATSPIAHGESLVLRLLGRAQVPLELEKLGLPPSALVSLTRALARPHGIVLLTGPTGSGKSTTLYAAINRLRRPDVKILTVEDPIEIVIDGINQVQVRPEIDLTYASALRAFLRQDPDIIMIGEIRDRDTAEIALRSALTGHLVLSTLHTNSALGAFTRLDDIGIEPYLAASTVIATCAQRLVRALCDKCRAPRSTTPAERRIYERCEIEVPSTLYEPAGCPHCAGTGFLGRAPLIEIVEIDEELRERVRSRTVEKVAHIRPPAETLVGHGLLLAAQGRTSLGEVERAVALA